MEWIKTALEFAALVFAAIQVLFLSRQLKDTVRWNRLNSTFSELEKFQDIIKQADPTLLEKIGLLKADDNVVDIDIFRDLMEESKFVKDLYAIMSFYEGFAIAVMSGYINSNIAKRLFYVNFMRAHKKLQPYILIRKQATGMEMFQHFQKLYDRWSSEKLSLPIDNYEDRRR